MIWICYTETHSEPNFEGYVNSKKKAIEWVKQTVEFTYSDYEMELNIQDDQIQMNSDEHYVIAVRLKKL